MTPRERAQRISERLPDAGRRLVSLGHGTDHAAFSAGPFVIRVTTELGPAEKDDLAREVDLLTFLQSRLPVAVPYPSTVAPELGGFAYRKVPGRPLLGVTMTNTSQLTDDLGALLRAMADIDTATVENLILRDTYPLDVWRDAAVAAVLDVAPSLTARERDLIRDFAAAPVPDAQGPVTFCHNDLGAEHLLIDEISGRLVGVLDWTDAAATDPCRDLGRIRRDLGSAALARVLRAAEPSPETVDAERIRFHAQLATLEDLHHGIISGDHRYTDAARRAFVTLFTPG